MGGIGRWGRDNGLDFWTALECGEVDAAEVRAVDLLRRTTDPERFSYYCQTGMLPTMGSLTGRIYLLERGGAALELEDGRPVASWCISIGPHRTDIPGTDHVVVLRNFVEGEELAFMSTGNRNPIFDFMDKYRLDDWLPDLFLDPTDESGDHENEEILELDELRPEKNNFQPFVLRPARIEYVGGNNFPMNQQNAAAGIGNYLQVQAPEHRVVQIAPRLGNGVGVDLPDGRVLHINEDMADALWHERGIHAEDEVNRMVEEGHTPEMIEHALNDLLWR